MTSLSTTIARFVVPPGRWLAGAFALSLALSLAMPTSALGAEPHRIVLLGARWCAPCMAEYAHLPELVRAAAPDRIVLAWIDRPIAVPAGLQGQVDTLPAPAARAGRA
jgi:thiol-disulfide isomerase/thioredoxin